MISRRLLFVMLLLVACALAQDTGTGTGGGTGTGTGTGGGTAEGTNGSMGEAASEAPTGEEVASEAPTGEVAASEATTIGEEGVASETTTGGEESASEAPTTGDGSSTGEPAPQDSGVDIPAPAASDKPWASEGYGSPLLGNNPDVLYKGLAAKGAYCKTSKENTGCIYTRPNQKGGCAATPVRGLSKAEKDALLNAHNKLRSKHALGSVAGLPTAANMVQMEWDNELAALAQLWADQCNDGHDNNVLSRQGQQLSVGQNMGESGTTGKFQPHEYEGLVQDWYNELTAKKSRKKYTSADVAKFFDPSPDAVSPSTDRGHFTQVVWATSTKLGCGAIKLKDGEFNKLQLYCNYGPSGNVQNEPVYLAGKACSRCPKDYKVCKSSLGLCAKA